MKLVSWNVNGLRACVKKGFVDWAIAEQPDVICLQETRLSTGQEPEDLDRLEGYEMVWHNAEKKGYSGVSVFSRAPIRAVHHDFAPRYAAEGRTLLVELEGGLTVVNGYFPNGSANADRLAFKLDYYADLLAHCCLLRGRGQRIAITGDLNTSHTELDLARPKANKKKSGFMPIERTWMDRYMAAGFVDTFRMFESEGGHYSWWTARGGARERNVGWRLDYWLVSEDLRDHVTQAAIHPDAHGSDHCPVSMTLDL